MAEAQGLQALATHSDPAQLFMLVGGPGETAAGGEELKKAKVEPVETTPKPKSTAATAQLAQGCPQAQTTPKPRSPVGQPSGPSPVSREKASDELKICTVCSGPAEKKSRYCKEHKQAYECLYRAARQDPQQHEAFMRIFGGTSADGTKYPYNDLEAARTLLQFTYKCPAVKGSKRCTKKRGVMDLTTISRTEGTEQQNAERQRLHMWDYELFVTEMRNRRSWSLEKACFLPTAQ